MELQGLAHRHQRARSTSLISVALCAGLILAAPGSAAAHVPLRLASSIAEAGAFSPHMATRLSTTATGLASSRSAPDPNQPVLVSDPSAHQPGYQLTGEQVLQIAKRDQRVRAELRRHPKALAYEYTKGPGRWQVSWFSSGTDSREVIQAYIDDNSRQVTEVWTGYQVAWIMARGYPGAFGRRVNALYVWIPLCVLFVAPFLPWRRQGGRRRLSLLHLDLLMLLGFSISLALFNHAAIGLSVPLVYPFLIYLLVRMLLLAFGRGRPRTPLRIAVPPSWLLIAVVFLVGFRVGLNIVNSNVIDVGYAGVIGADKLLHGQPLYGHWPKDNAYGDTYGPIVYEAYVPFRALFHWSGTWDALPAAHAAAIAFDLLTLLGLFFLGRLVRGPTLGVVLAYAWAAYPFTAFTLSSNTNDALVSLLVVVALLGLRWAPVRGGLTALAALTKFAPLALAPLMLRGTGSWRPRRSPALYLVGAVGAGCLVMLPVLLDHNVAAFWRDTVAYQARRDTPFSIWGLWGGLGLEHRIAEGAAVLLAVAVALVPRRRGVVEVAALGAAVLIALQLTANYWLYSYVVWFFPLVALALFASPPPSAAAEIEPEIEPRQARPLAVAMA